MASGRILSRPRVSAGRYSAKLVAVRLAAEVREASGLVGAELQPTAKESVEAAAKNK